MHQILRRGALNTILAGAVLGLVVPLLFRLLSAMLESFEGVPDAVWTAFDYVQLMLWPTPLLLLPVDQPGAPDLTLWGTFVISTLANVTVYATIAGLVWAGLAKARPILVLPLLIVAGIWFAVWCI